MMNPSQGTLAAALWPAQTGALTRNIVLAVVGSLVLAISARIEVPFWPVPMTMQVFVVLALSLACGARAAGATLALYLAEGAVGFPVFAGGGAGYAHFMGPTGGYLVGFLLAAIVVGWLADRGWSRLRPHAILAGLAGLAMIYAPGLLWLGSVIGWDQPVLEYGFTPFILADLMKLVLAALAIPALWRVATRTK